MKTVNKCAAQGDVLFRRVAAIPTGFELSERKPGPIVISHSETGHHHVVRDDGVRVFESSDPAGVEALVCYLQMDSVSFDVEHLRAYDTHETIRCLGQPGDVWEFRRQREHTPEGWRRVQD